MTEALEFIYSKLDLYGTDLDTIEKIDSIRESISVGLRDTKTEITSILKENETLLKNFEKNFKEINEKNSTLEKELIKTKYYIDNEIINEVDTLVEERNDLEMEISVLNLKLELLTSLDAINKDIKSFDTSIQNFNYKNSIAAVNSLDLKLSQLKQFLGSHLHYDDNSSRNEDIIILKLIEEKLKEYDSIIQSLLEHILENKLILERNEKELTFIIDFEAENGSSQLQSVLECFQVLNLEKYQLYLEKFSSKILKNFLVPFVEDSRWELTKINLEELDNDKKLTLTLILNDGFDWNCWSDSNEHFFDKLITIFKFLASLQTPPVLNYIGEHVYKNHLANIIKQKILMKMIPFEAKNLKNFEFVKNKVLSFEEEIYNLGFFIQHQQNDYKILSNFFVDLNSNFSGSKRVKCLELVKSLFFEESTKNNITLIEDINDMNILKEASLRVDINSEFKKKNENFLREDYFLFPKCVVSSKAVKLISIVKQIVEEFDFVDRKCAKSLLLTARLCLELYRALFTKNEKTMLSHNDFMYISHHCLILSCVISNKYHSKFSNNNFDGDSGGWNVELDEQVKENNGDEDNLDNNLQNFNDELTFIDFIGIYSNMAESDFYHQIEKQLSTCFDLLSSVSLKSLDNIEVDDYAIVESVFDQVCVRFEPLAKTWLQILPISVYFQSIGIIFTELFHWFIKEIFSLSDIGVDESAKIQNLMLKLLKILHFIFSSEFTKVDTSLITNNAKRSSSSIKEAPPVLKSDNKYINYYVSNYVFYRELTEILELSMVEITKRLKTDGWYVEFNKAQMKKLSKALFSDGDNRERLLNEIEKLKI
ncbi:hypothetical protein HDU92_003834 [Lobulomyces angularis]|nr:hypothetical protein HDU92_003834 [Lobulomyces angularis]